MISSSQELLKQSVVLYRMYYSPIQLSNLFKKVFKEKRFPTSISEADMYTARVTKDNTNIIYGKA